MWKLLLNLLLINEIHKVIQKTSIRFFESWHTFEPLLFLTLWEKELDFESMKKVRLKLRKKVKNLFWLKVDQGPTKWLNLQPTKLVQKCAILLVDNQQIIVQRLYNIIYILFDRYYIWCIYLYIDVYINIFILYFHKQRKVCYSMKMIKTVHFWPCLVWLWSDVPGFHASRVIFRSIYPM